MAQARRLRSVSIVAISVAIAITHGVGVAAAAPQLSPPRTRTAAAPAPRSALAAAPAQPTMAAAVNTPLGFTPSTMTTGDFTGHGHNDVLVGGGTTIKVLPSTGNGTFGPAVSTTFSPDGIAEIGVGDLNGDGKLDIVVVNGGTSMYVLMGNGDGSFQAPVTYSSAAYTGYGGSNAHLASVTVGALRPGAKPDIVVGESDTPCCNWMGMEVYQNNGDGTFGTPAVYNSEREGNPTRSVTIGDVTGDNVPDIVIAQRDSFNNGPVSVWVNNGSGGFTLGNQYNPHPNPVTMRIADLNGDGKNDIVDYAVGEPGYDNSQPTANVLLGTGGGSFASPVAYRTEHVNAGFNRGGPRSMVIADLNGSNRPDIVTANNDPGIDDNTVTVLTNNGDGTFQTEEEFPVDTGPVAVSAVDLNGDGLPDIVTANSGGNDISVLLNTTTTGPIGGPLPVSASYGGGSGLVCACLFQDARPSIGNPVDTMTGNFWHTFSDFSLPSRGYPLTFTHTYNSQVAPGATAAGLLGWGWTFSANPSLANASGVVTLTEENGSQEVFTAGPVTGGVQTYTAAPHVLGTLTSTISAGATTYVLTSHNQETETFNTAGQLTQKTDLNGYATTYTYNGNNQLVTITAHNDLTYPTPDPNGRSLVLGYATSGANTGMLTTVTDTNVTPHRVVTFAYDGGHQLTDVTDVAGGNTHFTYDARHQMLTMRDPRGNTVTNHYTASNQIDWQQDQLHRQTTFAYAGTPLTAAGGTTTIIDPKGSVTVDSYAWGLRQSVTRGAGTPSAATTHFAYDRATLGVTAVTDPNGNVHRATYDTSGNQLTSTDALGNTTTTTYNEFNEPLTVQDPKQVTTTMTYDTRGNLLTRSTPLVGSDPLQNQLTTTHYGDAGHPGDVTSVVDPTNQTWVTTYDRYGDVASTRDPLGNTTTMVSNADGWKTSSVTPKGNVSKCGCAATYTTTYAHDAFGNVTTTTDPLRHTTVRHYDADQNVDRVKDGDGNVTKYTFDPANEPTVVTRADTTTLVTDYNPDGTVLDQKDGKGTALLTFGYDSLARVTTVTDALGNVTTSTYDANGNRLTQQDPGGNCGTASKCTTTTYNADNEPTAISYSDGVTPNVTSITYDADGQRTEVTDGTGTSAWVYDALHRITSYTNGNGAAVSYAYDLRNLPTTVTYPGNHSVQNAYDNAGRMTSVRDWLATPNTTSFTYDANSNVTSDRLHSGAVDTSTFNAADENTAISDVKGTTTLFAATYTRDNNAQLASDSSAPALGRSYKYTPLNQLCYAGTTTTSACNAPPVGASAYRYDAADNLTTTANAPRIIPTTQQFNAADELCWTASAASKNACGSPPAGATTFGYDNRGNRTSQLPPVGPATCTAFDQASRMTSVTTGTGSSCTSPTTVGTYAYDAAGMRQSKTVSGTTTQFLWAPSGALLDEKAGAESPTYYVYRPDGRPVEQIDPSGTAHFYHVDQLGSVRAVSSAAGVVQNTYTYDPYGNAASTTATVANNLQFAGQYLDSESGLYYLRARSYDPATAQFLTRDPMVATTRSPYGYVTGNPLNATDPSGNFAWIVIPVAVGIGVLIWTDYQGQAPCDENYGCDTPPSGKDVIPLPWQQIPTPQPTQSRPPAPQPPLDDLAPGGTTTCQNGSCWIKNTGTCGWTQQPTFSDLNRAQSRPGLGDPNYGKT